MAIKSNKQGRKMSGLTSIRFFRVLVGALILLSVFLPAVFHPDVFYLSTPLPLPFHSLPLITYP